METRILKAIPVNIMRCAAKLKAGGVVAFPTETVYALGAVATNAAAVEKVYDIKSRPKDKPMIVAVADKTKIGDVAVNIPDKARQLIDRFMPGALTLLLDRAPCIPDIVTSGTDTVAVRIPDDATARKLIEATGKPVIVPSANTTDKPSPTLASHVKTDLDGKIEFILDGGESSIGIESTIIDTRTDPPTIIRSGGVTAEEISSVIGEIRFRREKPITNPAYIPMAEVMFSAYYSGMTDNICSKYDEVEKLGRAVIICLDENADKYGPRNVYKAGADYAAYAHSLFALLRRADAEHYSYIIAEGVEPKGIGNSLISRLIKISGGLII